MALHDWRVATYKRTSQIRSRTLPIVDARRAKCRQGNSLPFASPGGALLLSPRLPLALTFGNRLSFDVSLCLHRVGWFALVGIPVAVSTADARDRTFRMPSKKKVFKNGLRDGVAGKYTKKVTHLSLQDIAMKPAYNTTRTYTPEPPVPQAPSHQRDVWVPANPYLTAEIPRWLKIYSRASPEFDDQLKVSPIKCESDSKISNFQRQCEHTLYITDFNSS